MPFPVSPAQATVFNLMSSGGAFNTSLLGNIASTSGNLALASESITSLTSMAIPAGISIAALAGLGAASSLATVAASGGSLDTLTSHVTSQFSNLTNNAGLYVGQLDLQQGLQTVGSSLDSLADIGSAGGLCGGLNSFFGSVMGVAQGSLDVIDGAVTAITGEISAVIQDIGNFVALGVEAVQATIDAAVSAISDAITAVTNEATNILNQVATEISSIANALSDLLNFGFASAISSLFGNQCGKTLLTAVSTTEMLGALNAL